MKILMHLTGSSISRTAPSWKCPPTSIPCSPSTSSSTDLQRTGTAQLSRSAPTPPSLLPSHAPLPLILPPSHAAYPLPPAACLSEPLARPPKPATSAEAWATFVRSAPPLTTQCRAKGAIGTPNNVSRRRSYLLHPIVTPAPTYPCSVYTYDNYAPNRLLHLACGLLFCFRVRYGLSPLVQSRHDPIPHGQTPPPFNCSLPLVYLTRLRLPYCTPRPPFSSEPPYMPLARQPLSLLVTEWHKFLSVSPVVQSISVRTSSQDL